MPPKQTLEVVQANFVFVMNQFPLVKLTDSNFALIASYIKNHYSENGLEDWSIVRIHDTVKAMYNSLAKWTPEELKQQEALQAQAAAATEPAEVLTKLKDGTTQLPIDVSDYQLGKASKEQVRDIYRRRLAKEKPSSSLFIHPSHQRDQGDL